MNQTGNEKILGGLGALFVILAIVPYLGWLLWIAGMVLLLIALNKFSKLFGDKDIFDKFLRGFIISVVGGLVAIVFGIFSLIPLFMGYGARENLGTLSIGVVIAVLLIVYILTVISSHYYRESFNLLYKYTNVNLFKLAGTFIFWGAVALIAFGIGAIGIFVGWIILVIAFFTLPPTYQTSETVKEPTE